MNVGPFTSLLLQFGENWSANAPEFEISPSGQELDLEESHPIYSELASLAAGRSASLPFFTSGTEVVWCTLAPNNDLLRESVASLHAWILPSFGGEKNGDGYVRPTSATGTLSSSIISVSPDGYYRWRCPRKYLTQVCEKLRLRYGLESVRPPRLRPPRPSLYELRARFATSLLIGDREGAETIISLLDSLQLETAVNTQFMRIRLWHHFREPERIRTHADLPLLVVQPLPPRVRAWIDEAIGAETLPISVPIRETIRSEPPVEATTDPDLPLTWDDWFQYVSSGNKAAAETFVQERVGGAAIDLTTSAVDSLVSNLDELYVDDALRNRERNIILQGVSELLDEFVREPGFPRTALGNLYFAVFRLWGALYAGTSSGQEHGHVFLELASALLQLNFEPDAVRGGLEFWWRAKPSPSQLPFALDAIELLEREQPASNATDNLWIEVADSIKRSPGTLAPSDSELWRMVGTRLGFDAATISEYLPPETVPGISADPLAEVKLQHVAIICLREEQAHQAAKIIQSRSSAEVTIVTDIVASAKTTLARQADVVLFVWMASTHALFRAFDGFDRKRLCYVQGTGSSSIVRSLERWTIDQMQAGK